MFQNTDNRTCAVHPLTENDAPRPIALSVVRDAQSSCAERSPAADEMQTRVTESDGCNSLSTDPRRVSLFKNTLRLIFSLKAKQDFATNRLETVLEKWENKGLISPVHRQNALAHLREVGVEPYISDFASTLAVSVATLGVSVTVNSALMGLNIVSPWTALVIDRVAASVARTAYTTSRIVQSALAGHTKVPWLALGIGVIPIGGNAGYLFQQISESSAFGSRILLADLLIRPLRLCGFQKLTDRCVWWALKEQAS